jgi:sugar/nucleoside kinase (ribokinase family)
VNDPAPVDASATASEDFDVYTCGTVFLDIVFTGMLTAPSGGHEVWTDGMGSSPGGAANLAVACSRLGLRTALAAAFGGDAYGDFCWTLLEDTEGIDLAHSRRFEGWHSPVTVSLALDDDRAMVTHAHESPVPLRELASNPPTSKVCCVEIAAERPTWLDDAIRAGSLVFADSGWDPSETWDVTRLREQLTDVHAFVPNAIEAMSYTRTDTPGEALEAMRDWVPLAVVTTGSGGAFAADATSGETAWAPGVPVDALDPTGAGDVFLAGLILGTLKGWPLQQRLRFANLCAALSVRDFGGALAAPGWGEVAGWWRDVRTSPRMARDYAFLNDVIPTEAPRAVSRASATIGLRPLLPQPPEPSTDRPQHSVDQAKQ